MALTTKPVWSSVLSVLGSAGYVTGGDAGAATAYGLPAGQAQQMQMQFMRDQLRQELQQRSFLSHAQVRLPGCKCGANS